MKKSSKRTFRAIVATGVAGLSLGAFAVTGPSVGADEGPGCYIQYPTDVLKAKGGWYYDCTPNTRPEITTTTAAQTTTTAAQTTTTAAQTTTTGGATPTTATPTTQGETTTTAAPGVGSAGAARPIAGRASYTG